jgi:uncharacterized protein (TIGR02246 family)
MRRLCLLFVLFSSIYSFAQTTDEQQIRQIPQIWMEAYNHNDAAAATALYADDGYYVSQHLSTGIIQGREAIKANIQRGIDSGGHVDSIEVLTIAISGDMAYSVGTYQATNAGLKVTGRNIVVCRKINGKWLIVAHTSVVPEQPKTK